MNKDLIIPEKWSKKFDLIVKECSGVLNGEGLQSVADSLVVMNGIRALKEFFQQEEVKALVVASQDSVAGFLTDRSPSIIARAKAKAKNGGYVMKPYSYTQIIEALIPCALEGYRLHGNEINIISGKGMPVKAGKYRRIIEMTDGFFENIGTPAIQGGFAFIKCKAKWSIDGHTEVLGYSEDDPCHIKLKYGTYDSIDKAIGLAQSKLYSRVLTRIMGKFVGEEPSDPAMMGKDVSREAEDLKKTDAPDFGKKRTPQPKQEKPATDADTTLKQLAALSANPDFEPVIFECVDAGDFKEDAIRRVLEGNLAAEANSIVNQIQARMDKPKKGDMI